MSSHRPSPQIPRDRSIRRAQSRGRPSRKSQRRSVPSPSVVTPWHRLNSPPPTNDPTLYGEAPLSPPPETPRPFRVVAAAPAQPDPEPPAFEPLDEDWTEDVLNFAWLREDKPTSDETYYLSPASSNIFSPSTPTNSRTKRKASSSPPPSPTPKRLDKRRKEQTMVAVEVCRRLDFNPKEYQPLREDEFDGVDWDSLD
ncbi:uncharacterized protein BO80DRAFT_426557 [Aspergillus ibericus CBS 121593]|uniref:Uncharacterized protein n=1 Tax=Aspergillus ibericus CBS 121593 TaxID=1448316 RepID=A0A395GUM3_9EURO|nr:hypothetical protein BO80DRAFT_426557 [Aspergillus ibericus CBS 121593]RAK99260.1 hypothetical protein BO80DRAFT_426557 [Aspergillus ibericus CBS 121593]